MKFELTLLETCSNEHCDFASWVINLKKLLGPWYRVCKITILKSGLLVTVSDTTCHIYNNTTYLLIYPLII